MQSFLLNTFPTTLRIKRKKLDMERHLPLLLLGFFAAYDAFAVLGQEASLLVGSYTAFKKVVMLYCGFLIMLELAPDAHQIYKKGFWLMGLGLILPTQTSALASIYFLLTTRILTKSSGYLTSMGELVFITAFTMVLFTMSGFSYPMMLAIVLILDYRFKHKDNRNLLFIVFNILISLFWFKNPFGIMTRPLDIFGGLAVFFVSIAYILRLSILKNILSMNDIGNNLISPRRVKSAGILMILSMILLAIGYGELYAYVHLWIMLAAISLPYWRDIRKINHFLFETVL